MNRLFKTLNTAGVGLSTLGLGVGLLGASPTHASLIGDDITLDLEFSKESSTPLTVGTQINTGAGGEPAPQSTTVVDGAVEFPSAAGIASSTGEFGDKDFTGEEPFSAIFTEFNVETDFIEGRSEVFWGLIDPHVAPFTWTYTFSDLDFATEAMPGASLSSVNGTAMGSFFAPGVPSSGKPVEPIVGDFTLDFGALLSLDVADNAVTLAIEVNPVFGSDLTFTEGSGAFGSAIGSFRIDLASDDGDTPARVPEPATLLGLLLAGGLGLARLKHQ